MDAVLFAPPLRERMRTIVVDEEGRGAPVTIPAPQDLPLRDAVTGALHLPLLVVGGGAADFLGIVRFGLEKEPVSLWIAGPNDPWIAYTTLAARDPYNLIFHFFGCDAQMQERVDLQDYVSKTSGLILLGDDAIDQIAPLLRRRGSTPPFAIMRRSSGHPAPDTSLLGRAPSLVVEPSRENVQTALNAVAQELLMDPEVLAAISAAGQ